jgi:hypothetical protein
VIGGEGRGERIHTSHTEIRERYAPKKKSCLEFSSLLFFTDIEMTHSEIETNPHRTFIDPQSYL